MPAIRADASELRKNFSKTRSRSASSIPIPWSFTINTARSPSQLDVDADDAARRRVLDRVREQVPDHLREAVAVAVDHDGLVGQLEHELVRVEVREEEPRLLVRQLDQVDGRAVEPHRAAFEQLHVEEVACERRQPTRLRVDDLEIAALLVRRKVALEQQRREAEHRRERRAELVGDHADQVALVLLALA